MYDYDILEVQPEKYEAGCYRIIDNFNPDLPEGGRKLWRWLL